MADTDFTEKWRIKHGEPLNYNERIVNSACDIIDCQAERIKELEAALESIWPFIEEDFPKGTGVNHGTCASDLYLLAAKQLEQARKG